MQTSLRLFALLVYGLLVALWLMIVQRPVSQWTEAVGLVLKVLLAVVIVYGALAALPLARSARRPASRAAAERELAEALAGILEHVGPERDAAGRQQVEAVLARYARIGAGRSRATQKALRTLLQVWRQRSRLRGDQPARRRARLTRR